MYCAQENAAAFGIVKERSELTQARRRLGQLSYDSSEEHVYVRSSKFIRTVSVSTMALATILAGFGQAQTPAPVRTPSPTTTQARKVPVTTATVRGTIADPTGALIPGATVNLINPNGTVVATTTSDASGTYAFSTLPPGTYSLHTEFPGFAPVSVAAFPVTAGQIKHVEISMSTVVEQQSVTVTDEEAPMVSVEASGNTSSVVLKGNDLDALSDDPDELSNELTALAGPSAGPNGGEVYISGFTGGQLPPKSAIREIRVNQNPYSAEFDHIGYGRIEILTKPGTDQLHGRFFSQGNDDTFNTGNPFTANIPAYHSIMYNGSVSGSLGKKASFFFNVAQRNNQNASIYTVNTAVKDQTTGLYSAGKLSGGIFNPTTYTNISPRFDVQLGDKHTLTFRYQFERSSESGAIGSIATPETSSSSHSTEHTIQASDAFIINDHIVNETRFQYLRDVENSAPISTAPGILVAGSFSSGGSSSQSSNDHGDRLELQNITTMSAGAHALKFGTRMRYNRDANNTNAGYNGSFTFSSLNSYLAMLNGLAQGQTYTQIAAAGGLPLKLSYSTGNTKVLVSAFDAALFLQDDWKVNPFLTLSAGLRWESQNHINDHNDFGPRFSVAYALDGHKDRKQAKTVLRGGYGYFYDRLRLGSLLNATRFDGGASSQTQYTISNPTCFDSSSLSAILANPSACGSTTAVAKTVVQIAPNYKSPYTGQFSASLERQLTKTTSLTLTYMHSYGLHQMVTRNANAYLPGTYVYGDITKTGVRPDPNAGILQQYYPEGIFKQNQLIVNVNARITRSMNVSGFYNWTAARSNTGTASNSYNLMQDYRRAPFAQTNMLFLMGSYTDRFGISYNPFLIAQSGRPYNFTSPVDLSGDNFFNNRPSLVDSSSCTAGSSQYFQTSYGCFNIIPNSGETIVPGNMGTGPAAIAFNLRVSRTFGVGPKRESAATNTTPNGAGGPPPGGPPPGGGRGFGGPGGGGGGGRGGFGGGGMGGGGMFGGGGATNRKYALNFSVQALNLFNNINYGPPIGTVSSSRFGQSTSLAYGMFSSGAASRRIFIQAGFTF